MDGIDFLKPVQGPINLILKLGKKLPLDSLSNSDSDVAPVVVTIPSVTQLHAVRIKFRPAKGGIGKIMFDEKTGTFYLLKVTLNVNTEVIMRNLVAYEAMTKLESLLFTRYTELMCAIVNTVEDVEVLVEKKIVVSSFGDDHVEKLFNGMSKSIGPTKTPNLDKTIEKVNKYYNGTQKVKSFVSSIETLLSSHSYSNTKYEGKEATSYSICPVVVINQHKPEQQLEKPIDLEIPTAASGSSIGPAKEMKPAMESVDNEISEEEGQLAWFLSRCHYCGKRMTRDTNIYIW
ncbi:UPF0481 plant-like protein [Quillaja saponaria]|uniref:UPF0481 plant-like protein n=1 Tax=Quillaja saponaria TaxID=32244 RepID=A0AAD7PX02_QUISA|nr:UPF0481 plant-like protein [Quillaja saponaria]